MKKFTAIIASVLGVIITFWYCYLIATGRVRPVLATWILFTLATTTGIWTYLKSDSGNKDLLTNIVNTIDVCATWTILIFILCFGIDIRYGFSLFEILCVTFSIGVLLYWKVSKKAKTANVAINIILTVGYIPTIVWLWGSETNTESFFVWGTTLLLCTIALYNPIKERNRLALLYTSRAVILVSTILILMARIELM